MPNYSFSSPEQNIDADQLGLLQKVSSVAWQSKVLPRPLYEGWTLCEEVDAQTENLLLPANILCSVVWTGYLSLEWLHIFVTKNTVLRVSSLCKSEGKLEYLHKVKFVEMTSGGFAIRGRLKCLWRGQAHRSDSCSCPAHALNWSWCRWLLTVWTWQSETNSACSFRSWQVYLWSQPFKSKWFVSALVCFSSTVLVTVVSPLDKQALIFLIEKTNPTRRPTITAKKQPCTSVVKWITSTGHQEENSFNIFPTWSRPIFHTACPCFSFSFVSAWLLCYIWYQICFHCPTWCASAPNATWTKLGFFRGTC